ncbi:MAG: monofunctional biosynthetic peptidoglycan transglycosylase, partial [Nitrospirota bacterium]
RLASVLPNPRRYNPLGDSRYVTARSNLIYSIMIKRGIVVPQYEEVWGNENKEENPPDSAGQPETQRPANQ